MLARFQQLTTDNRISPKVFAYEKFIIEGISLMALLLLEVGPVTIHSTCLKYEGL